MRDWPAECVDLIYLDPPFNSDANYNNIFKGKGLFGKSLNPQVKAYEDIWTWGAEAEARLERMLGATANPASKVIRGFEAFMPADKMLSYASYMAERLFECWRVLKPTGSLYLHCDPTANSYLRLILDAIFDDKNFRNEIVWKRTRGRGHGKRWGSVHDSLLFYTKSKTFTWNNVFVFDAEYVAKTYKLEDERGRYSTVSLTAPGVTRGEGGKPYKDYDPATIKGHWKVPRTGKYAEWIDQNVIPGFQEIVSIHERLAKLEAADMVVWSKNGIPRIKRYIDGYPGTKVNDLFLDIPPTPKREQLGYPTQKPLALLDRIIRACRPTRAILFLTRSAVAALL